MDKYLGKIIAEKGLKKEKGYVNLFKNYLVTLGYHNYSFNLQNFKT